MQNKELRASVMDEVAKFARHGRLPYEHREGDVILKKDGTTEVLHNEIDQVNRLIEERDSIVGIYPIESFISTPSPSDLIKAKTDREKEEF